MYVRILSHEFKGSTISRIVYSHNNEVLIYYSNLYISLLNIILSFMRTFVVNYLVLFLLSLSFSSCEQFCIVDSGAESGSDSIQSDSTQTESNEPFVEVSCEMLGHSSCKDFLGTRNTLKFGGMRSAGVIYNYEASTKKLNFQLVNAGFNCCPYRISCNVLQEGDSLIIEEVQEFKGGVMCKCNCLFDIDLVLNDVLKKRYQVVLVEPYIGNQEELSFPIDLAVLPQDSVLVPRTSYPWGY